MLLKSNVFGFFQVPNRIESNRIESNQSTQTQHLSVLVLEYNIY